MAPAWMIISAVALQRVIELVYASRNAIRLKRRGGIEFGRKHYPLIVLLHLAWILTIAAGVRREPIVHIVPLLIFGLLQILRVAVIATLGTYWTTRVISVPGVPLVSHGPYRYLRHPNYLVVAGEIAALPLVFGQVTNAVIFSLLNAAVLAWRIRVENAALASRRTAA